MAVTLLDASGRPIDLAALKRDREQAPPTLTGVRTPWGSHPASGLTPRRLAQILRESIEGDPERYLELAEDMEERDAHYAAVLGVRKRQVSGLEVTVEAASDDARDVAAADLVREVIERDSFADELIDILDSIGKGFSATEIIWDTSEGQWRPAELKWRDPRWFTFDQVDRETLLLREAGGDVPLRPGGWIRHVAKAKSGLTIRGGLARAASWLFLFKSFTIKDWAVFCEAFGQPIRVGKYDAGASDADKAALARAVANIGSDYGATIPASMILEFVKADVSGSIDLYERRAEWLDRQVSKLVLGQTQTTDATAGGYATAKVHDGVRDDIEIADARQLAATLARDLVWPLVDFNFGPPAKGKYPKLKIGRPDEVDVAQLVDNVTKLLPFGLKVGMSTLRDKLGLPDPDPDEELLGKPQAAAPAVPGAPGAVPSRGSPAAPVPPGAAPPATDPAAAPAAIAAQRAEPPAGPADAIDRATAAILDDEGWVPLMAPMVAGLKDRLAAAATLADVEAILAGELARMDVSAMAETLARAAFSARISGEADEPLSPAETAARLSPAEPAARLSPAEGEA